MMRGLFRRRHSPALVSSRLYDELAFYPAFLRDLSGCKSDLLIESPFITGRRMKKLYPYFRQLAKRGVKITINTRDPREHEPRMRVEAEAAVAALQELGVRVLYTDNLHRKLAILDQAILWEGSLNILSQYASCEVMRRTDSCESAAQMIKFLRIDGFLMKS